MGTSRNIKMSTKMGASMLRASFAAMVLMGLACGASQAAESSATASRVDLPKALAAASRPQADRDRDANRKPAELMQFLGVKPGMTALDVIAAGGYMTEVLALAVGPQGKVYSQNPPVMLGPEGRYLKQVEARHAGGRLPNVVRVDADLPAATVIPPGSVDVAITALNFHDVHNKDAALAQSFLKGVYSTLKPGGVFGIIDHVGLEGANNAQLHRVPKQVAIDAAKAAGFTVEAESNILANPQDDHTKGVFEPALRGKTDQFVLKLRKPK
jgi:predicted methyltransferase